MQDPEAAIEIRTLTAEDDQALARLAERDSAEVPVGRLLGASVDGRLVAAHSLPTGRSIADPFVPTAEIRILLADRADQLRGGGRRGLLKRLRRRSRGALPSSPPGAGGKLLRI